VPVAYREGMKLRGVLLVLVAGCGGGGTFDDDATCALAIAVSGGLDASVSGSASTACATQLGLDQGMDVLFITLEGEVASVGVVADDVAPGVTGDGYAAAVRVEQRDAGHWSTAACTLTVLENDFDMTVEFGDQYRTVGAIECSEAAQPEEGDGPALTIDSFELVVTVTWAPSS
jgi:hypothetical protein